MAESRLARRSLKQSKKQLYVSLFGILAVIFIALNFGPSLIGTLGNVIDKITGKTGQQAEIKSNAQIQPPTLDPIPDATPSASITVTGKTDYPKGTVELYVNNSLFDQKDIDSTQVFKFENITLTTGNNSIKARMVLNDKKSDFSDIQNVSYTKGAPKLDISFPSDHQSFNKADQQITVKGTTDSQNSISVNSFVAIVDNNGNFSYDLNLNNGDNKITVVATDIAGNTTPKDLTVSYSP